MLGVYTLGYSPMAQNTHQAQCRKKKMKKRMYPIVLSSLAAL